DDLPQPSRSHGQESAFFLHRQPAIDLVIDWLHRDLAHWIGSAPLPFALGEIEGMTHHLEFFVGGSWSRPLCPPLSLIGCEEPRCDGTQACFSEDRQQMLECLLISLIALGCFEGGPFCEIACHHLCHRPLLLLENIEVPAFSHLDANLG